MRLSFYFRHAQIYGVLPAAASFIALYSKMASVLEKKTLFYSTCVPFFIFFLVFDRVIYPHADTIQPSLSTVQSLLGGGSESGGRRIVARIIANWTSALFYVVAELYSSVSVGLLFWQFANDVVPVGQAKRFYPLFAQLSGLAPIVGGQFVVRYSSKAPTFRDSLQRITIVVTLAGCAICLFYRASNSFIAKTEPGNAIGTATTSSAGGTKTKKKKVKLMESAKFLASSEYLRLICTLVVGYGLTVNFTEIMWKSLVKKRYPDALDYQRFMGNFSSMVGLATCIVIVFGMQVICVLGWRVWAMATPVIMAVLAVPFFVCILTPGLDNSPSRLGIAVTIGTIQSLVSKTSKYALFDPTTQMSYIPLDEESKIKGKAAIDVFGSRVGKSGGSFLQQLLVLGFGNILNAAPAVAVLFYSVLAVWTRAAHRLSVLFRIKTEEVEGDKKEK